MSGGSMDYLSYKVQDAAFRETTPARRAFREHLSKVAAALHAIEWNDSGDGAVGEKELILACLSPGAELAQITTEAREVMAALQAALAAVGAQSPAGEKT